MDCGLIQDAFRVREYFEAVVARDGNKRDTRGLGHTHRQGGRRRNSHDNRNPDRGIAAIPTALPMVSTLTTPYRANHPDVNFTILSRTSIDVLKEIENLEVDAGLTYIDNEPLGRVTSIALYREEYRFLTSEDALLGDRQSVTWAEVGKVPLCLLTTDMQNRRIIDRILHAAGVEPAPTLQSNSMVVLYTTSVPGVGLASCRQCSRTILG
jgi:hypothetical protein